MPNIPINPLDHERSAREAQRFRKPASDWLEREHDKLVEVISDHIASFGRVSNFEGSPTYTCEIEIGGFGGSGAKFEIHFSQSPEMQKSAILTG